MVPDGRYRGSDDLASIRGGGRTWLARPKSNRPVRRGHPGTRAWSGAAVGAAGTEVWLPVFGSVKVLGIATPDGGTAHRAANDLGATDRTRVRLAELSRAVEDDRRGIEQRTGVERCRCRSARARRNHLGLALRAFPRFEARWFARGVRWADAETAVIRDAVRTYPTRPHIRFPRPPTA